MDLIPFSKNEHVKFLDLIPIDLIRVKNFDWVKKFNSQIKSLRLKYSPQNLSPRNPQGRTIHANGCSSQPTHTEKSSSKSSEQSGSSTSSCSSLRGAQFSSFSSELKTLLPIIDYHYTWQILMVQVSWQKVSVSKTWQIYQLVEALVKASIAFNKAEF